MRSIKEYKRNKWYLMAFGVSAIIFGLCLIFNLSFIIILGYCMLNAGIYIYGDALIDWDKVKK